MTTYLFTLNTGILSLFAWKRVTRLVLIGNNPASWVRLYLCGYQVQVLLQVLAEMNGSQSDIGPVDLCAWPSSQIGL